MAEAIPAAERPAGGAGSGAPAENARPRAENERWRAGIAGLRQRLEELERQLGLHSANSGKPPSSDRPRKPPAPPLTRSRSGKRPGRQSGHKGTTLQRTDRPDHIESHGPAGRAGRRSAGRSAASACGI